MGWVKKDSVDRLAVALEAGNSEEVSRIVDAYLEFVDEYGEPGDRDDAERVFKLLRDYTHFDLLVQVAEKVAQFDADHPVVRKSFPAALIDSGQITRAVQLLRDREQILEAKYDGLAITKSPAELRRRKGIDEELVEVRGLLGRAYKQLYIDAKPNLEEPRHYDLDMAVKYYWETFQQNTRNCWHGINYVACKTHAERVASGNPNHRSADAQEAAKLVLREVVDDPWGLATKAEAQLALGQNKDAIESVRKYLDHDGTTRFMINSTLRQFREVWNLDEYSPPGKQILPMLRAKLLRTNGAVQSIPFADSSRASISRLEKVWGDTGYQDIMWLQTALERSRCVARLGLSIYEGEGTGFLFDGSLIGPEYASKHLLLTNAHVCTSDDEVRNHLRRVHRINALRPEEAVVAFLGVGSEEGGSRPIKVMRELFTSPPESVAKAIRRVGTSLDATLLELKSLPNGLKQFPFSQISPVKDDRVNIIGHPGGRAMSVSIQDNKVVEVDEKYLWYRSPTDPGSSGSPIFDQFWKLVGLHHSSSGLKKANEGLQMKKVVDAIKAQLQATNEARIIETSDTQLESKREFVKSLPIDEVRTLARELNFEAREDALPEYSANNQAVAIGSQIAEFGKSVPIHQRPKIVDSLLLAQLAANKVVKDGGSSQDWNTKYTEVLSAIGWMIEGGANSLQEVKGDLGEVHKAILPLLVTALGGPGVAAATLVVQLLEGLAKMDENSPWITLFNRATQRAEGNQFQISHIHAPAGDAPKMVLTRFELDATRSVTQVLFFKFSSERATLRHGSSDLSINTSVLEGLHGEVENRIKDFVDGYVKSIEI